jgi:hypothetical protein
MVLFLPLILDSKRCFDLQSDRLEVQTKESYYTFLALHYLMCLVPFCLCWWQPFRSRGIIPFLVVFAITFAFTTEIRTFFLDLETLKYECLWWSYITIVFYDVPYAIPGIFYLRYFIIINLKNIDPKYSLYEVEIDGRKVKKLRFYLKMLKHISHPISSFFLVFCYYLINYIVYTIILATEGFKCTHNVGDQLELANAIVNITIFVLTMMILAGDLLLNVKTLLKCKIYDYLFVEDPYFYRMEIFQVIPFVLLMIGPECMHIFDLNPTAYVVQKSFHTICFYYLLWVHLFFPALVTLILLCTRGCNRHQVYDSNNLLDQMFENEELWLTFLRFSKGEWSQENALFFQEMKRLRGSKGRSGGKSVRIDKDEAYKLFEMYLNGTNSLYELNVERGTSAAVKKELDSGNYTTEVFDDVLKQVKLNMKDILNRFCETQEYKKKEANLELRVQVGAMMK